MLHYLQLSRDIQARKDEATEELKKQVKLKKELTETKAELDSKEAQIKGMTGQIDRYREDIARLEQQLKEQRVSCVCVCLLLYWS